MGRGADDAREPLGSIAGTPGSKFLRLQAVPGSLPPFVATRSELVLTIPLKSPRDHENEPPPDALAEPLSLVEESGSRLRDARLEKKDVLLDSTTALSLLSPGLETSLDGLLRLSPVPEAVREALDAVREDLVAPPARLLEWRADLAKLRDGLEHPLPGLFEPRADREEPREDLEDFLPGLIDPRADLEESFPGME